MKMAALIAASGIGRSTIHAYRNSGLLPPPERRGPKLHVYGDVHLACLRDITHWRKEGHSLDDIRERLRRRRVTPVVVTAERERDATRAKVVQAAALLFLDRGYDGVELNDILRAAGVARVTFYRRFSSKTDCFLACVDALRFSLATATERAGLGAGGDFSLEARRRITAVVSRARGWLDLNRLILQAEAAAEPALSRRARASLHRLVTNAEPSLRRAQRKGVVRRGDTELMAYMSWGALLFAGYWLELRAPRAVKEVIDSAHSFLLGAVSKPKAQRTTHIDGDHEGE